MPLQCLRTIVASLDTGNICQEMAHKFCASKRFASRLEVYVSVSENVADSNEEHKGANENTE